MLRNTQQPSTTLDLDVFQESNSKIQALKSRLPETVVENLAKEVLLRLKQQSLTFHPEDTREDQIESLCHALLSEHDHAGAEFIENVRSDGASLDTLYLKYLAEAARLLGHWWDTDKIPFSQVALGTSRMYAIMRALRWQFRDVSTQPRRAAVFMSVPGETHTLGVRMAADLCRKEGWDIELLIGETHDEVVERAVRNPATIIGISAAGSHALDKLSRLVIALRIAKPAALIFLSGEILKDQGAQVDLLGLDGTPEDYAAAQTLMSEFVTMPA